MRRIVGIIVFAVGLLLLLGHIVGVIPDVKWLGIFGMFVGAACFGLSFIPQPAHCVCNLA